MHWGSGTMGWGSGIGMIAFWIIIIVVIVVIVKMLSSKSKETKEKENPIQIINRRYANGELSKEEFDSMKKDLEP